MKLNLYDHFLFKDRGDDIFLYLQNGEVFTYKQVDERVAQFCCFFKKIGLVSGDRVLQQSSKCLDALCLYLAIIRYGAIYVPFNPDFKFNETIYFIYPLYFKMRDSQTHRLLVQSHRRRCVKHAVNTSL